MKFPFRVPENLPRRILLARKATAAIELAALGLILVMEGLMAWQSPGFLAAFYSIIGMLIASSVYRHALRLIQAIYKWRCLKTVVPDLILIFLTLALIPKPPLMALVAGGAIVYDLIKIFRRTGAGRWFIGRFIGTPEKAVAFSFIGLILIGTILLMMPRSSANGLPISFIDALFTATSAHCVTGLTVLHTGIDHLARSDIGGFSAVGQIIILVLIQTGGLGIMTLSSASIALFAGRLKMNSRDVMDTSIGRDDSTLTVVGLVRQIVVMTVIIEIIGALMLSVRFWNVFPTQPDRALWFGLFHSISAFCNAGFSLFSDSLVQFRTDPIVNITVIALIILGGLGFPVLSAVFSMRTWADGFRTGIRQLSIHAKLVLLLTGIMIAGGAILLFIFDFNGSQAGFGTGERIWASIFQSVTARTAGFNTVDIGQATTPAIMVFLFLMFVGTAPGGTGGGIKITTFAMIVLSVKATMRRRSDIELFNRSVHSRTIHNVVVIAFVSLMACFLATFLLTWLEPDVRLERALFESVSAFGTVGLSMNLTMDLHWPAKLLVTILMYVGRIGPLTLTLALARRTPVGVSYPQGRILVG